MASQPTTLHGPGNTGEQSGHADRQPTDRAATLNVLVDYRLDEPYLRQLEAVDPRVRVLTTFPTVSNAGEVLTLENRTRLSDAEIERLLPEAEVLFSFGFPIEWVDKLANLKWVQLASAGSDAMQRMGLLEMRPDLLLTTASGVHEIPISEHIVAMILFFSRRFNIAVRNQPAHTWSRFQADEAYGKTALLIGYGPIARRTAAICKALNMRVLVVRGSISEQAPGDGLADTFYPNSVLNRVLAESDYVIVAAPLTNSTRSMLGAAQFEAMKPSAVLINISRGAIVDEEALIAALREGRLAGAGLDVFAQEPLPESSPLWDMPNVLITPHTSGSNPHYNERATAIFADNLARYVNGQPLRNRVLRERGY
jgi:phosphoglycerate dehydrogenase-like enzyme